jgi:hypothetical protein
MELPFFPIASVWETRQRAISMKIRAREDSLII